MTGNQQKNALGKYLIIGAVRIMGIAMMAIGFAIVLNDFLTLETFIGYVLIFVGGFEFIIMPILLARAWKTPDDRDKKKNAGIEKQ